MSLTNWTFNYNQKDIIRSPLPSDFLRGSSGFGLTAPNLNVSNVQNIKVPSLIPVAGGMSPGLAMGLGVGANMIGGKLIGGDLESNAGSIINGAADLASAIPGPWGAAISGGMKLVGGLVNRVFGSKLNKENIAQVENKINTMNNFTTNASSFDSMADTLATSPTAMTFSNSFIGKDGWFSKKAKRKVNALRDSQAQAMTWVDKSLDNNLDNIYDTMVGNTIANYAALGGNLRTNGMDWNNGITLIGNGGTHEQNPLQGIPIGVDDLGNPNLVEEGEVIWNNYVFSNRLPIPKDLTKLLKVKGKNLTFADVAKKLQKESEERPNDPISKRGLQDSMIKLQIAQELLKEQLAGLQGDNNGRVFAGGGDLKSRLGAIDLSEFPLYFNYIHPKGSTAYGFKNTPPNTPAKNGGDFAYYKDGKYDQGYLDFVNSVSDDDATTIANHIKDYTGKVLTPTQLRANATDIGKSGGGYGVAHQVLGQLYSNKVNTHTLNTPWLGTKGTYEWGFGPGIDNFWQAQAKADKSNNKELVDAVTNGSSPWEALTHYNTAYKDNPGITTLKPTQTQLASKSKENPYYEPKNFGENSMLSYLRYAPALGAGIGVFSDLMGWTNKPDYTNADFALNSANRIKDVRFNPIGDYMRYTPLDREFYINQLNAQAGSTRRAIANNSGGNRGQAMAGILASDYGAQGQLGQLARQAEEFNLGQRERVAAFNRATNMFNSENDLKAQMYNNSTKEMQVKANLIAAQMRDAIDARVSASKSANLTNLFDSLGNIGIDTINRQDRDKLIRAGVFGTLSQKPYGWSNKRWQVYQDAVQGKGFNDSKRTKIKTKTKKGLTI